MLNLGDDKELDHLSREAAGKYTPPGAPDWEALSSELDRVMPVEKKKRRIIFWWLLLVLLAGGAYWFAQKNGTGTPVAPIVSAPSQENATPVTPGDRANKEALNNDVLNDVSNDASTQTEAISATPQPPSHNLAATKMPNEAEIPGSQNTFSADHPSSSNITTEKLGDRAPGKTIETPASTGSNEIPSSSNKTSEPVANRANQDQSETGSGTTTSLTQADARTPIDSAASPTWKDTAVWKQKSRGLSFGVLAGVDESTVKFKYGNNAGYNVGVAIGYHFNDRLSVHTGAVYTQKKYKVAGADFTPPKGTMLTYYKIEDVNGSCNMWEFPLLVRYTISRGKRNNVFASAGVSSYLMTKEDYHYRFYNGSGALTSRNAAYYSGAGYLMSVAHLSAGFENRLSKNLSLIIEPYAKLPLAGVGFGSIRLSSFGLNFGVQFRR